MQLKLIEYFRSRMNCNDSYETRTVSVVRASAAYSNEHNEWKQRKKRTKCALTIRVSISVSIFLVILCLVEPSTGEHLIKKQSSTLFVLPICGPLETGSVAAAAFSYNR